MIDMIARRAKHVGMWNMWFRDSMLINKGMFYNTGENIEFLSDLLGFISHYY